MRIKMDDIVSVEKKHIFFKVSWKMTNSCNYRCPYCYMAKAVAKGDNHTSEETVLKIASKIDDITSIQAKGRTVQLHLIGGEVSQYNLINVLDKIKKVRKLIIVTNFSAPTDYWLNLKSYCKKRKIQPNIIASFHLTQCDHEGFIEKAIKVHASVKSVINPDNINEYKPYFEKLKKNNIRIEITVERDSENSCKQFIDKEIQDYVDTVNDTLVKKDVYFNVKTKDGKVIPFGTNISFINSIDIGGFDPEGFLCTAGLDDIRILPDGRLQRAGCRHASILNDIGNILGEYTLPTKPIICHTTEADKNGLQRHRMCTCFCNTNMYRNPSDWKNKLNF